MPVYAVATLADLRAAVKRHWDEESTPRRTTTQIDGWLNESNQEHWKLLVQSYEERDATTNTFVSVADQSAYALATVAPNMWDVGFFRLHRLNDDGSINIEVPKITSADEEKVEGFFLRGSDLILTFPGSSVSGGVTYRITLSQLADKMVDAGDACALPATFENVIIYDVVQMGYSAYSDSTNSYRMMGERYHRALAAYIRAIEERVPYGSTYVTNDYGGHYLGGDGWIL